MAEERETLLEVKDLEVTYGSGKKAYRAVNRANFKIYKGETFGLVGESGSRLYKYLPSTLSYLIVCQPDGFTCPIEPRSSVGIRSFPTDA